MQFPTRKDALVSAQERDATVLRRPSKAEIERLRKRYPVGTQVELVSMNDKQAPPAGTVGRVWGVDDAGSILVRWKNGSSLNLLPDVDEFRIIREDSRK